MELTKQLGALVEQATSDSHIDPPVHLYEKILAVINSRVDMPKHTLNAVSKRLSIKNKKVLFYCFDLLEYLSYRCELSLYSQISTKQFLLKTSGILMNQDLDSSVHTKILQTVKCWEELFRPHEDLLPMYFQFYAGLLRKEFPIQKDYLSPHRPKDFTVRKRKPEPKKQEAQKTRSSRERAVEPTKTEQQTFQSIREKIILTNEIIDNANPGEGVKSNPLLIEMMEEIKGCQKKINQTINENPNEKIMELALATNDDIYITYRRYKDLQKNRKPEPFILTELASDAAREKEVKEQKKIEEEIKKKKNAKDQFDNFDQPSSFKKVQEKPKQAPIIDIMDLATDPVPQKSQTTEPVDLMSLTTDNTSVPQKPTNDLFDLLGGPSAASELPPQTSSVSPNNAFMQSNYLGGNQNNFASGMNLNTGMNNITLNEPSSNLNFGSGKYATENDFQKYDDRSIVQKITDLTEELRDIRKET